MTLYLLFKWLILALIVLFTAWIVPGIEVDGYITAFIAAITIALINISLKPALKLITLPINIMSLGLFSLVINSLLLMFVSYLVSGFEVDGFISALLGSIIMSVLSIALNFI